MARGLASRTASQHPRALKIMELTPDEKKRAANFLVDDAIGALTRPDYHELNKRAGRNDRLLHAVMCAYAKHTLGNEDIGWEQLGHILHNAICNEIGSNGYLHWAQLIKP